MTRNQRSKKIGKINISASKLEIDRRNVGHDTQKNLQKEYFEI